VTGRRLVRDTKLIRAFHCTRLLDHEVGGIKASGLLSLNLKLVTQRIDRAEQRGYLTKEQADELRTGNLVVRPTKALREELVAFFTGRYLLDERPQQFLHLLKTWGGEGIYFGVSETSGLYRHLKTFGKPSIVVADLDSSDPRVTGRRGQITVEGDVPPEWIKDIWQPGHPEYDKHRKLPQT
jgi:hypothetical protein